MRFLHYRQLLRGLIAASLSIAGAHADIASAGIQSTRWSQICLLNDREYDPWDASDRYEPLGCLLEGATAEDDLDDCIQANRFHIDRQIAFSLLHHHLPRIHCSTWIHGFRTTGHSLGDFLAKQFQLGRTSRGHLVDLSLALGRIKDDARIDTAVEETAEAGLPVRDLEGNLFVYVFREESDSISNFDSCFAESLGGRPPVLEGDQQAYVATEAVASTAVDSGAVASDAVAAAATAIEDGGLGHCSVPSSEEMTQPETRSEEALANQQSDLVDDTLFQEWVSPDWNIQHWEIHTYAPRYEYKLEGFAAKPMFPADGLLLDLSPNNVVELEEEESMASLPATVSEPVAEEVATTAPSELEAWFSISWNSMLESIQRQWSELEPAAQELSSQSTRVVSRKLKDLGMLLIQSADRLDQVSLPIGIAGRSATQR